MSRALRRRIVAENRTGSGIIVGTDALAKAARDGLTVLTTTIGHAAVRALFDRAPLDPVTAFSPAALVGQIAMILMVRNPVPVRTLRAFMEVLRANPGRSAHASGGNGGAVHLASELFLHMAGGGGSLLRMDRIAPAVRRPPCPACWRAASRRSSTSRPAPCPSSSAASCAGSSSPPARGDLLAPAEPTSLDQDVAGYEAYAWHMVLVPGGAPAPLVGAINAAVNRSLAVEAVRNRLAEPAVQVVPGSAPDSAAAFLRAEMPKWHRSSARRASARSDCVPPGAEPPRK